MQVHIQRVILAASVPSTFPVFLSAELKSTMSSCDRPLVCTDQLLLHVLLRSQSSSTFIDGYRHVASTRKKKPGRQSRMLFGMSGVGSMLPEDIISPLLPLPPQIKTLSYFTGAVLLNIQEAPQCDKIRVASHILMRNVTFLRGTGEWNDGCDFDSFQCELELGVAAYCSIHSLCPKTPPAGPLLINQWLPRFYSMYSAISVRKRKESSRVSEYKYASSDGPVCEEVNSCAGAGAQEEGHRSKTRTYFAGLQELVSVFN